MNRGRFNVVINDIKKGYSAKLLFWTFCLVLVGITFTIINGAFEFSRTGALISLLIGVITTIIVYYGLNFNQNKYGNPREMVENLVVYVFTIQAVISIFSFLSPAFKSTVSLFQFEGEAAVAEEAYAGVRGLALSGRLYFEYAVTCGLATLFQFKRIIEAEEISPKSILILLLIVVCGFFAGRTALVGFGVGLIYILFSNVSFKFKTKFILRVLFSICVLSGIIWIVLTDEIRSFITEHLLPWVFDVFIKYFETGSTESSHSFNALNEMYKDVQISEHEWIVGSGIYTEPSGRYYGHVDAGYLRQILYWGILGTIISLIYTIKIFQLPWKVSRNNINQHLFILTILIYTLIVHYKGDLLSISRFYYVILYLYFISIWQTYTRNNCIHTEFHS